MKVFKKYIRTKDNVYKVLSDGFVKLYQTCCHKYLLINGKKKGIRQDRFDKEVIKQADTIEELCDEFVFVWKNGTCDLFNDKYKENIKEAGLKQYKSILAHCNKGVYGAIWTDKGLMFVARMNNEGVLELL